MNRSPMELLGASAVLLGWRAVMFKFAVIFLLISLVAGGIGLTNISTLAKRISMVLFALFFLGFLALFLFAYLLGEAFNAGAQSMAIATVMVG
jgi:uncharacterized membrane protein YtjA (UPF0391 family)